MPLTFTLSHLVSALLSLAAGACLYLILLNRVLIGMRDRRYKLLIIRGVLLAIGLAAVAFGWWAAGTAWLLAPALVLLAVLIGELRRLVIRRRCRGAPPVETVNWGVALSRPDTTTDLAVLRYELPVPAWRGPDLRIVHVSDLHLNGDLPMEYFHAALARAAEAQPDLLFYTGDFVTKIAYAAQLPDLLGRARGRLATVAVLGNHDYWAGAGQVAAAVRAGGVTLLGNGCQALDVAGQRLLLCGYEGPWSSEPWQPPHVAPGPQGLALLLTHTPDNIQRLRRLGFDAVFAGHTHAGQIRLPLLGSLVVPSRYGRLYDHGHFCVGGTHLFVTAGVGSAVPPKRIYCQPDIFVVDVRGAARAVPQPDRLP